MLASSSSTAEDGAEGASAPEAADTWSHLPRSISGRVQRFGDGVDTDAIIPAQFMG